MGSLHGAESCELVGLHLLNELTRILNREEFGLYRDDGLIVTDKPKCSIERLAKSIRSIFNNKGFKITVEIGLKRAEFLDVVLDLNLNSYRPFRKPNSETIYMSKDSNHPRYIKKQIPAMVNKRLNLLSKNKSDFDFVKSTYDDALKKSRYQPELEFVNKTAEPTCTKRKRRRNIIYFQPPFSLAVKTPIGRLFLKLVKKHFTKNHPLYKILNFRCLKISYCCLNNIKSEIAAHNRRVRSKDTEQIAEKLCNCRSKKDPCPLEGKCLTSNLVYKADITTQEGDHMIYLGTSGNTFKERYTGHKTTFKHERKKNTTELSKYFWSLKDQGKTPHIKWSIAKKINSGFNLKNGCTLCNTERYEIASADKQKLLNTRNERKRVCPHYAKKYF